MRAVKILLFSICFAILGFILSINYIFVIPLPDGSLHYATLIIGSLLALIWGLVAALVANKIFKKKDCPEQDGKFKEVCRLHDAGILSDEEYKKAKDNLISKL